MEARDVLPDHVQVGGPQALVARVRESRRGEIVGQGVEPHVHGLLRVARERDPPDLPLARDGRSEEHTSELQSLAYLVCRLLLEKKKKQKRLIHAHIVRLTEY